MEKENIFQLDFKSGKNFKKQLDWKIGIKPPGHLNTLTYSLKPKWKSLGVSIA